ncbi:MAG: hypothetical protein K8E24_013105, partial [Methanobacterium paludis]|nr:hypothetical protein [Methanobacterium paludis]
DGIDQGTITIPQGNSNAYYINLTPNGGSIYPYQNAEVELISGSIGLYYFLCVPHNISGRDSPYTTVRSVLNDVRQGIEKGG